MLCGVLPDPPANVPPPEPPTPGLTTRQRFEMHDMNACTGACHAAMDPIGYGFEHYDGIGAYRTTDQNLPVDSNGSITLDGKTQTFADAVALAKLLAESPAAQACFAKQMTRYALNRWDSAADAASIEAAATPVQGHPQHARPDLGGGHVAHLPLPGARRRGGAAMSDTATIAIRTSKTAGQVFAPRDPEAPRHRRRVPAAAVDRARARRRAQRLPEPLHRDHLDGRHLPAQLLPDHRGAAAGDVAFHLQPLATWASKMIVLRHATKSRARSTST